MNKWTAAVGANDFYIGAANNVGVTAYLSTKKIYIAGVGGLLSVPQGVSMNTGTEALMDYLGLGVQ